MHTNVQTFGDNHATSATRLACIARIYANNLTTGAFCLVVEHLAKHTERSIVRGQGQIAVARHEREIQVFNCDQTVGLDKSGRRLVPEVAALVGNMLLHLGNLARRFAPTGAKSLAPGQATLRDAQFAKSAAQPTWIVDQHAIGQGQQTVQTHIDANRRAIMHDRRRLGQFHLQADIPLVAAALEKLNETDKARRTLMEMLGKTELEETPEFPLAKDRLQALGGPLPEATPTEVATPPKPAKG